MFIYLEINILLVVMDVSWDVRVQSSHGVAGGASLLTCLAPSAVRSHVTVTRWFRDGNPMPAIAAEAGKSFSFHKIFWSLYSGQFDVFKSALKDIYTKIIS